MNQQSYYAVIPANVRYSKEICDGAKLLYGEITALSNQNGYCWATNKYFADLYGKSSDTVSRWIGELSAAGFIITLVDSTAANSRKIWLAGSPGVSAKMPTPIGKNADTLSAKMPTPIGKNAVSYKENNTKNNTKEERDDNEKNSLPTAENSTLEAAPLEGDNLPGGAIIELHDPELPGVTIHDTIPPAPITTPPAHRIELGDRPSFSGRDAETPVELQTALRAFYADWPNEWSVGVLENGRGSRYSVEQRGEIVKDFCCWAVKNNQQRDTYRQLNAALQNWFRNEQHSTWKQSKPGQNGNGEKPVYERPKNAIY